MKAEPEGTERTHSSAVWHWFTWTFAILFIAYPLSLGPVASFYYSRGQYLNGITGEIYEPLWRLTMQSETANRIRNWYVVEVWGVHWE